MAKLTIKSLIVAPTTKAVGSGISFPRLGEGRDGGCWSQFKCFVAFR